MARWRLSAEASKQRGRAEEHEERSSHLRSEREPFATVLHSRLGEGMRHDTNQASTNHRHSTTRLGSIPNMPRGSHLLVESQNNGKWFAQSRDQHRLGDHTLSGGDGVRVTSSRALATLVAVAIASKPKWGTPRKSNLFFRRLENCSMKPPQGPCVKNDFDFPFNHS